MSHGGARNRSGPAADPSSERSEQRGLQFKLLPREGFTGRVPAFPLPKPTARERAVWRELWRTPQAAMWNVERWRMRTVGMYCRWTVRAEALDATAATMTQTQRLGDQLGLTPAGLKENGWRLAVDEVAQQRATGTPAKARTATTKTAAPTRRLRVVSE
jgi:hypothetical protein